jgi:hypothetical protein
MPTLDDQPLRDDDAPTGPVFAGEIRPQGPSWAAIAVPVLLLLALAAGAFWWWRGRGEPTAPAAASSAPAPAAVPAATAGVDVPPLAELDPFIRQLLGPLSPRPELARFLESDGLAQRLVAGIAQVASGASPARDLALLRPAGTFETEQRGRRRVIAESSFHRYDGLAATVASVDAARVAQAYRLLAPRLQEAYDLQGRPGDVDAMLREGLDALIATPIPDGPIEVRQGRGNSWIYADPALERLTAAQKQLLRMGPDNARAVQQRLREVRAAIAPPT